MTFFAPDGTKHLPSENAIVRPTKELSAPKKLVFKFREPQPGKWLVEVTPKTLWKGLKVHALGGTPEPTAAILSTVLEKATGKLRITYDIKNAKTPATLHFGLALEGQRVGRPIGRLSDASNGKGNFKSEALSYTGNYFVTMEVWGKGQVPVFVRATQPIVFGP